MITCRVGSHEMTEGNVKGCFGLCKYPWDGVVQDRLYVAHKFHNFSTFQFPYITNLLQKAMLDQDLAGSK